LQEAQALGFAEADPTNDVEGYDTAYKIAILSSIAFKKRIEMSSLYCKGITSIAPVDIEHARTFGYVIKLVGLAREAEDGMVDIRVHPMLVPDHHPLANVFNEFNAICVRGDAVGDVMFYGRGAGEMPTASAVMGDVLAITNDLVNGNDPIPAMQIEYHGVANLQPILETRNKYYIRLNTTDLPGVIGRLGTACGDFNVSLESVMQRSTNPDGTASIVLVTHEVGERQMQGALEQMVAQESTQGIGCVLRILG
jgi:homoserine dehydrogenase